jgi:hypothetical protein
MPTRGASTSDAPGYDVVPVTKSDTIADPNGPFRGFIITTAGTLKIQTAANNARTFASGELAAGVIHAIRITRVWSTGTAAVVVGVV